MHSACGTAKTLIGRWVAQQRSDQHQRGIDARRQRLLEALPGWTWDGNEARRRAAGAGAAVKNARAARVPREIQPGPRAVMKPERRSRSAQQDPGPLGARTCESPRAERNGRVKSTRRQGRYLVALAGGLALALAALLVPGRTPPAATLASSSVPASSPAAACTGVTPAVIPALGFIANPGRTQGGHFWWRGSAATGSVCVGTVVEWVHYTARSAKTWDVIVYSAQHPDGQVAAERTYTLSPGWYWWPFGVHQAYAGLQAVCITATDGFGEPCVRFGSHPEASGPPSAAPAAASSPSTATPGAATAAGSAAGDAVTGTGPGAYILRPMPAGTVSLGRGAQGHLLAHVNMYGLTPGSSHDVTVEAPTGRQVAFPALTANSARPGRHHPDRGGHQRLPPASEPPRHPARQRDRREPAHRGTHRRDRPATREPRPGRRLPPACRHLRR